MRQDVLKVLDAHILKGCEDFDRAQRRQTNTPTNDQLAAVGAQAMAIAHELRQPLFTIALANENLRKMIEAPDLPRDAMRKAVARIEEQVQRAQEIVIEALDCAASKQRPSGASNLVQAMQNAICFLEPYLAMSGVVVEQRPGVALAPVPISRVRVEQIFVNVLCNAVESIQSRRSQGWVGEGRIAIAIEYSGADIVCIVSDNGAGLQSGVADAAFKPFFTTKSTEGTGLGLCICQTILEAARGDISLSPGKDEGAVVTIRLPLREQPPTSDVVTG